MSHRHLTIYVMIVTAFCGGLALTIGLLGPEPLTPPLDILFKTSLGLFSAGFFTVLGLLGGKANPPALP